MGRGGLKRPHVGTGGGDAEVKGSSLDKKGWMLGDEVALTATEGGGPQKAKPLKIYVDRGCVVRDGSDGWPMRRRSRCWRRAG